MKLDSRMNSLVRASKRRSYDTLRQLDWPDEIDVKSEWGMSQRLLSLYATEQYNTLCEEDQKKLSWEETRNFFSLNVRGEQLLIAEISLLMYSDWSTPVYSYLHHFIEEENRHMYMFASFCDRYLGGVKPMALTLPHNTHDFSVSQRQLLAFLFALTFEIIVSEYNKTNARDKTINSFCREIHRIHDIEEARHIAFGIDISRSIMDHVSKYWTPEQIEQVGTRVIEYIRSMWNAFSSPDIYRSAGLVAGARLSLSARESQHHRGIKKAINERIIRHLLEIGIIGRESAGQIED